MERDSTPRESPGLSPASQSRRERMTMTTITAKRILVPLDGDERSEAIVPLVAAVARDGGAAPRVSDPPARGRRARANDRVRRPGDGAPDRRGHRGPRAQRGATRG